MVNSFSGGTPSKNGSHSSLYWNGDIPWVSPKDFKHFYIYDSEDHISERAVQDSATQKVPVDSVLVVVRSGILKHTLPVGINKTEVTINQDIRALCPKERILPEYLGYYLNTFQEKVLNLCVKHSTTVQSVNTHEFFDMEIPIPPLDRQKSLSTFLNKALKNYHDKNKTAKNLLESLLQEPLMELQVTIEDYSSRLYGAVRLKELTQSGNFSVEYYHPERMAAIHALKRNSAFKVKTLSDVVDFCRNIVHSVESGEPYLGLAGVERHTGELTNEVEEADGQAFTYQVGDVLYGRLRPYLNKVLFAEKAGICSMEFHVMRVKNGVKLLPEYLAEIMRSDLILSQTKHMMTGNTHPRISNNDVKNLCIPIPSISVQQRIINKITSKRNKARALREEAEKEWTTAKQEFEKKLLGE